MTELKTKPSDLSVEDFLNRIEPKKKREYSFLLLDMFRKWTKLDPVMWGDSIVGFGSYHYVYATKREGDWLLTGFSPRKQSLTIYIMSGFENFEEILSRLGKYKLGKSCLYIKKIDDIDISVLEELVMASIDVMKKTYEVTL
ncbi:MAG: DUF1801 domain-containing protein [Tissierellales bacterium]|jgi:hypothetical protein|nr:DUF1801 domain-containing protein [Tissierellales bacterium]